MEITYDVDCGSAYVCFREWDMVEIKKYYYNDSGVKVFVPELGEIPEDCKWYLPDEITKTDFEDAVTELAKQIDDRRGFAKQPVIASDDDIKMAQLNLVGKFDAGGADTTAKLIGIIEKLVSK